MGNMLLMSKFVRIYLLFIIVFMQPVSAQNNTTGEQFLAQFKTLSIASGTFTQRKYFKILKQPIISRGDIHLAKGLGLVWQTNTPVFSRLLLKNNELYSDDGQQPSKKIIGGDALANVLMNAMTGNMKALKAQFTLDKSAKSNCVSLIPIDKQLAKVIDTVLLCGKVTTNNIQTPKRLLDQVILFEHAGNRTEIDLVLAEQNILSEAIRAQLQ